MKDFLKMLGAVLAGLLIWGAISSFFSMMLFVMIVGSSMSTEKAVSVSDGAVLKIDLSNIIGERSGSEYSLSYESLLAGKFSCLGLMDVDRALDNAASDPKIKMVYLYFPGFAVQDQASVEAIRDMVMEFRENSGKPVVAFGYSFSNFDYYLASAADSVFMRTMGDFSLCGLGSEQLYLKGALDKLGITATVIRHGKFKSAVEPFLLDKMSDENREQTLRYLNDFWDLIVSEISESRDIPVDTINAHVDSMDLYCNSDLCVSEGFLDGVLLESDFDSRVKSMLGLSSDDDDPQYISVSDYQKSIIPDTDPESRVAVIYADGEIAQEPGEGVFTSDEIGQAIRDAASDDNVKAVVLRVNSPGGVVVDAEIIYRELQKLKETGKPLVVSMGGYAASGGYWISSLADRIFAQNTTVTGSIGAFGLILTPEKLMKNTLGINIEDVSTHKHSMLLGSINPMSDEEVAIMQRSVEDIYGTFLEHVATGRDMTVEAVDSIAQGRVWTGKSALELGLVDEIGGLSDAIDCAAGLADIMSYQVKEMPAQKDEITRLLDELMAISAKAVLGEQAYEQAKIANSIRRRQGVQAYMPAPIIH